MGTEVRVSKRDRRKARPVRSLWKVVAGVVIVLVISLAGGGLAYGAHLENNDGFCASCHTQPETLYFERSLAAPVDLATFHTTKAVTCIDCHSGDGSIGRVSAMTSVALPDLAHYLNGHYRSPATTTVPVGDDHCLKCHANVPNRQDFNNHFHVFLATWQARSPNDAASCVDCHQSHVTGGIVDAGYLQQATTDAVCQRCHASLGAGG